MTQADLVDNNPKTRVGALKSPLHLVPPSAELALAEALADGAKKYGPYNWREEPISVSVYVGAMKRHLAAFWDGEDVAEDSGVHHLKHVMACCALMIDADSIGKLQDDRPTAGAASELLARYMGEQFPLQEVTGGEAPPYDLSVAALATGTGISNSELEALDMLRVYSQLHMRYVYRSTRKDGGDSPWDGVDYGSYVRVAELITTRWRERNCAG